MRSLALCRTNSNVTPKCTEVASTSEFGQRVYWETPLLEIKEVGAQQGAML